MKRTKIQSRIESLSKELFGADNRLRDTLLETRMTSLKISKLDMFGIPDDESGMELREFSITRDRYKTTLEKILAKFDFAVRNEIEKTARDSVREFKEKNRMAFREDEGEEDEQENFLVGDDTNKQMTYTIEATTKTHFKRLAKFIRLLDYMMLDSRRVLIKNTYEKVIHIYIYIY